MNVSFVVEPKCLASQEVVALIDAPAILVPLPDGGTQIEKAGIVGVGATPVQATADWGRKFSAMLARPSEARRIE